MTSDCLKAKWLRIVKIHGWKGYTLNEYKAFVLGYYIHQIEAEFTKEPLALKHSTQLAELEQKISELEGKILDNTSDIEDIGDINRKVLQLQDKVNLLKTRLDASTRLGGSFLNEIQMLRIILNLVIDEKTEKIILDKYPEFKWVIHNRANILKRLKK